MMMNYSLLAAFLSIFTLSNAHTSDAPQTDINPLQQSNNLAVNNAVEGPSIPVFAPEPPKKKSSFWSRIPCCGGSSTQTQEPTHAAVDVGHDLLNFSLLEEGQKLVDTLKPLIIQYGPQVVDLVKTHGPDLVDKVKSALGTAADIKKNKGKKSKKNKEEAHAKLLSIDGMTEDLARALVPMVQKHGDVVVNTVSMYKDEYGGVEKVANAILDVHNVYFS